MHKYQSINEKVEPGIDHYSSIHARSLQVSKYLCIDDKTDKEFVIQTQSKRLFEKKKLMKEKEEQENLELIFSFDKKGKNSKDSEDGMTDLSKSKESKGKKLSLASQNDLNVRYCHEREIKLKRLKVLKLKAQFAS